MNDPAPNPYSAPAAYPQTSGEPGFVDTPFPASLGRRFANNFIDGIALAAVFGTVGWLSMQNDGFRGLAESMGLGLQVLGYLVVYVLPEALFGRTLGKLVTRTKVVTRTGGKPTFSQVLIRTVVRWVPFEPLSFLWGDNTGWHDDWSKTLVVPLIEPYSEF